MNRKNLTNLIFQKKSVLCVGLDSEYSKIPQFIKENKSVSEAVFDFNRAIIDSTISFAVAYKPNLAFYEALGLEGWTALYKTVAYLRSLNQPIFIIADAKRADIGNTSRMYANAFFGDGINIPEFDAVTIAPYMGNDSVIPFLSFENKWAILLALTSNAGADDFQMDSNGKTFLFEKVLEKSKKWGTPDNLMYVVGATKADMIAKIRQIVPENFLLIPGVGAQGGNLLEVLKNGWITDGGLLINASRSIIFASQDADFDEAAAKEAQNMQKVMADFMKTI